MEKVCTNDNSLIEKQDNDKNDKKDKNDKPYWILQRKIPRPSDSFARNIIGECSVSGLEGLNANEVVSRCLKVSCSSEKGLNLLPKDRLDIVLSSKTYSLELGKKGWYFSS